MTNETAPAPWTVASYGPALRYRIEDANGEPLASTYGQPTQAHDAIAMAAAPAMLKALKWAIGMAEEAILVREAGDDEGDTPEMIALHREALEEARAAIAAAEGPGMAIDRHARSLGFAPFHTGGGCMALERNFGRVHSVLVTDDDGSHLPGDFPADSGWIIGIYDDDSGEAKTWEGDGPAAFQAALAEAIDKAETLAMEDSARLRGDLS